MRSSMSLWIAFGILAFGATSAAARNAVTDTDLTLRAGPGTRYEVLLTMPAGAGVRVKGCSRGWCGVTWNSYSGYASQSGLRLGQAGYRKAPAVIPVFPNYPYRAGYYPKADWYFDLPPYAATLPNFHRRRYFMMAQERNRYRYMPHVFRNASE